MKNKVYVFVSLYKASDFERRFVSQSDYVYLIDNGYSTIDIEHLPNNCIYVRNESNKGLSLAFNSVIKEMGSIGDNDFLFFFDQDSRINDSFIHDMTMEFEKLENKLNIGLLGATFTDENIGIKPKRRIEKIVDDDCSIVPTLITSSMLTRFKYLRQVGFWSESIFLDFADFDLSFKFRAQGLCCVNTKKIIFSHTLGEKNGNKEHYLNPFRYYYIIRDSVKLCSFKYINLFDRLHFVSNLLWYPLKILFFEDKKTERLFYYKKGLMDGIKKINGEIK